MTIFQHHDLPTKVNLFPSLVLKICRSWASVLKLATRCGAWPGWSHHNKILICTSRSTRVPHIFGGCCRDPIPMCPGTTACFWEVGHDKEHDPFIIKEAPPGSGPKIVDWPQTSPLLVYDYMICIRTYIYICDMYPYIYICDIWYSYPTYLACLWTLGTYSKNIRISLQGKWCLNHFGWNEVPYFQVQNPRD